MTSIIEEMIKIITIFIKNIILSRFMVGSFVRFLFKSYKNYKITLPLRSTLSRESSQHIMQGMTFIWGMP